MQISSRARTDRRWPSSRPGRCGWTRTPYTCAVDYGDGSGALSGTVAGSTCTGPARAYAAYGSYTVTVTDKDGGVGTASAAHKVVYKFSGFFTGVPQLERERVPMTRVARAGGIDQPAADGAACGVATRTWRGGSATPVALKMAA